MRLFTILLIVALSGCNSYQKFYTQGLGSYYTPSEDYHGQPQIRRVSASEHSQVHEELNKQGYVCLGQSSFSSGMNPSEGEALRFAKKLGADIVVLSNEYSNTVHGSFNYTTPTQSTTYHSGNVNTYGNYGSGTGYYSGSSTTYGTQTVTNPYSISRYNYRASFFVYDDDASIRSKSGKETITDPEYLRKKEELYDKWDRGEMTMQENLDANEQLKKVYLNKSKKDYQPSELFVHKQYTTDNFTIDNPPPLDLQQSSKKAESINLDEEKRKLFVKYRDGEISKEQYFMEYKSLIKLSLQNTN